MGKPNPSAALGGGDGVNEGVAVRYDSRLSNWRTALVEDWQRDVKPAGQCQLSSRHDDLDQDLSICVQDHRAVAVENWRNCWTWPGTKASGGLEQGRWERC